MIDGNDRQSWTVASYRHLDGGLVKSCVDIVDGNWVVWIGSITADIANYAESAVSRLQTFFVDKRRYGLGEVDAIDEDVGFDNLWIRSVAFLCFGKIPFLN